MKRKGKAVPDKEESENESDYEVPEGINDLMNLPIELLRKELISRKFQPTVINNLPHWQLSAMLRESTSNNYDSFFYKIMGYSSYWNNQTKPAFTKKSIDEFQQNKEGAEAQEDEAEEEEDPSEDDINAKEFKKGRRRKNQSTNDEPDDLLDPDNYQQKYANGQFKYFPKTLILDTIYKREVPPEYQPPEIIPQVAAPEVPAPETKQDETKEDEIDDDPNAIPVFVNTKLLNSGVSQSSIDNLTPEQVKKIREEIKSYDFDVQSLIAEYNLQIAHRRIIEDSQFTDTQTQRVDDESSNSNSSSSSSSSSSNSSSSSGSTSDKDSDEKEDDENEDDHMNEIY